MSFTGSCSYPRSSDTTNLFLFPQIVAETLYSDLSLLRCGVIRHILQLQIWILAHDTTSAGQQRSHHVQSLWRHVSSHLLGVTVPDLLGRNFFKTEKQTDLFECDTCVNVGYVWVPHFLGKRDSCQTYCTRNESLMRKCIWCLKLIDKDPALYFQTLSVS